MSDLLSIIVWSVVASLSATILSEWKHKQELYDRHIKCIEMREIPVGACSRLFGEKK